MDGVPHSMEHVCFLCNAAARDSRKIPIADIGFKRGAAARHFKQVSASGLGPDVTGMPVLLSNGGRVRDVALRNAGRSVQPN